jgi:hypothetical protein
MRPPRASGLSANRPHSSRLAVPQGQPPAYLGRQEWVDRSAGGHNRAIVVIPPGSPAKAAADSAAGNLNVGALIDHVRFTGNTVFADAPDGTAVAGAAGLLAFADDPLDVRDGVFAAIGSRDRARDRLIRRRTREHRVLTLRRTDVSHNTLRAFGATGNAQGGGIWNGRRPDSQELHAGPERVRLDGHRQRDHGLAQGSMCVAAGCSRASW